MNVRTAVGALALACVPMLVLANPAEAASGQRGGKDARPQVLAEGLVGPLALAVAHDGTAYVSEQFAGRLTSVSPRGRTATVVQGPVAGVDATSRGNLTVTLSAPPEEGGDPLGAVARVTPRGQLKTIGSLLEHEVDNNPDAGQTYGFVDPSPDCSADAEMVLGVGPHPYTGIVESNPYAVLVDRGVRYVADAAGNSIVRVRLDGSTSTVAVLPPLPPTEFTEELRRGLLAQVPPGELPEDLFLDCVGSEYRAEPVPTDIEKGPDGRFYVSSLPGFPEAPGTGAVYRVDPRSGKVKRLHGGLNGAVDLAVAKDGTIYVAELFGGQLTRIKPSGARSSIELDSPGAVEVGKHGSVYVTTGVFDPAGNGTLVRYKSWPKH